MMIEKKKILSTLVIITLIATVFFNVQTSTVVLRPFVLIGSADEQHANNDSSWHNESWLNVTVESKRPRILWYDFQKCTNETFNGHNKTIMDNPTNWTSKRNTMTETDNSTWYKFIINISSDQGWDNIEYINISCWHDNGSDDDVNGSLTDPEGYNRSGNLGANRNFFLMYENTTGNANYTIIYPTNGTEITLGNFSELTVDDTLGIDGQTETHNISFCFKPGYQFRYAPGPGESEAWTESEVNNTNGFPSGDGYNADTCCWESFDNTWSWNFNITVENQGESWGPDNDTDNIDRYKSWVNDEFGIYSYTEIVSADSANIFGAPGERHSTNGSSWYNDNFESDQSQNVTVVTRSNGNYSMTVNISNLYHIAHQNNVEGNGEINTSGWDQPYALQINNSHIFVRGGNRTESVNFSTDSDDQTIWLYGYGDNSGVASAYQRHEVNGTCKYTGENASDIGLTEQYPNHYDNTTFNSLNTPSYTIEFAVEIPDNQIAGKYSTHVYYHLMTETN